MAVIKKPPYSSVSYATVDSQNETLDCERNNSTSAAVLAVSLVD